MSNLTECKSCGHQIAKTAKTCPACGAKNTYVSPVATVAAIVLVGGVMIYSGISDLIPENKPPLTAAEQQAREEREAERAAKRAEREREGYAAGTCGRILERSLRDPTSLEWDRKKSRNTLTNQGWLVIRSYSAENAFGGRRVGFITCQFDQDNKLIDHTIAER